MYITIRPTGRFELSCENSFELLGNYISLLGMSTETKKEVALVEPPP